MKPLTCLGPSYEIVGSDLYTLNIGTGVFVLLKGLVDTITGLLAPPINAVGYHPGQNYLYGVVYSTSPQYILRIGAGGFYEAAGPAPKFQIPASVTTAPLLIGDIDGAQQYWLGYNGGSGWVQVNLDATSVTYGQVVASGTSNKIWNVGDWAWVPQYPNRLYALGQEIVFNGLLATYNTHLVYFDTILHAWVDVRTFANTPGGVGLGGLLGGSADWGAVYTANDGNIYGTESNSGQTWRFPLDPLSTVAASYVTTGVPTVLRPIDGARCPYNDNLAANLAG